MNSQRAKARLNLPSAGVFQGRILKDHFSQSTLISTANNAEAPLWAEHRAEGNTGSFPERRCLSF